MLSDILVTEDKSANAIKHRIFKQLVKYIDDYNQVLGRRDAVSLPENLLVRMNEFQSTLDKVDQVKIAIDTEQVIEIEECETLEEFEEEIFEFDGEVITEVVGGVGDFKNYISAENMIHRDTLNQFKVTFTSQL